MRFSTSTTSSTSVSLAIRAVSRWVLGIAGVLWVAIAASLCGCSPISPVNSWVMNESGKAYYKRGEYALARQEFQRALLDSPQDPDCAFNVAAAMEKEGDHTSAERMYRYALTLDPSHQPAYHGMAAMYMETGRTAEASDLLSTWAATQPYSSDAAAELAWLKSEQGDVAGADQEIQRALSQNPRHTRALTQLARIHRRSGRNQDAAADYSRSLFMDPDQPQAQAELASLGQGASNSPALQLAATMPVYDRTLQASPYPAFTAPQLQSQPQQQLAGAGWSTLPSATPIAPMGYSMSTPQSQSYAPPVNQVSWSQPQMQPVPSPMPVGSGQPSYPTSTYPDTVPTQYSSPQPYNTARPTTSFFQPQQTFQGSVPSQWMQTPPMPQPAVVNSYPAPTYPTDAPHWNTSQPVLTPTMAPVPNWNTPPAMNASYGTAQPAEQISSVPVVPAF